MFAAKGELFTVPSGYQISRSVRFRNSATAYLSRSPASSGNQQKMTFSFWVKRGQLGTSRGIYCSGASGSGATQGGAYIQFPTADTLSINQQTNNAYDWVLTTTQVFRDPSAWYHIVLAIDTTQATSSNRVLMYVNGVQVTAFSASTYPTLNLSTKFNSSGATNLAATIDSSVVYIPFDGYMTEVNFVDGQALTPSSFGEYDTITGVWKPKKYTGTYGANGFYLNFSDNSASTAATIGKDYSGNGNNWTPNNISVTAGVTYDSMLDVPTSFPDGGNGRGNYATLNPIGVPYNTGTAAGGNLNWTGAATADKGRAATISMSSGKWYWECTVTATGAGSNSYVGIVKTAGTADSNANRVYYRGDGAVLKYGTSTTGLTTYTTNDVIGIAYDYSAQTLAFYKNNTLVTTATSINLEDNLPWVGGYTTTESWAFNAGQRPFTYTPPSGFLALNTQNLPTPTIANGASYMAATTYTGTGAALTIANSANNTIGTTFQPDFVWIKDRSAAASSNILDSVRGVRIHLESNTTSAETTEAVGVGLTAFNSNGFSLGTDNAGAGRVNFNGDTFVAWQWNAGGSTVTNTSGTISAQVRANPTAGFSVITWTGTGANATVGHGLGVAPSMIINKPRGVVDNWISWHTTLGSTGYIYLNLTNASATGASVWNSTLPTSTVFSVGTSSNINSSGQTMVSYCFAAVAGYSAFGSYTGNGSTDGPFIYTGFRPRFLMVKAITAASVENWSILDTSRSPVNVMDDVLWPNVSTAEQTNAINNCDFTSNGFKFRTTDPRWNSGSYTYIYMAFAENPFKYSLAR